MEVPKRENYSKTSDKTNPTISSSTTKIQNLSLNNKQNSKNTPFKIKDVSLNMPNKQISLPNEETKDMENIKMDSKSLNKKIADNNNNNNNNNNSKENSSYKNNKLPEQKKEKINTENLPSFIQKTLIWLKSPYHLILLIILTLATNLRLKYFSMESIWNDASVHLWYAQKVLQEPLFLFSQEYLLGDYFTVQTLTAFVHLITDNIFIAGKVVAFFFSILGIIFVYLLAKELKNKTTGLIAAALFSTQHLLWFYGIRLLADGPLASMFVISLYGLVKLEKEKNIKWGILTGIFLLLTILTKRQAIIFPVALMVYYIIYKRKAIFTNKPILYSWLISFALPMLSGIFLYFLTGTNILKSLFFGNLFQLRGIGPETTSVVSQLPWTLTNPIIVLAILGGIITLIYKEKKFYGPIFITLFYAIWFEIGIGLPLDRYLLPIIPVSIILSANFIYEISSFTTLILKRYQAKEIIKKTIKLLLILILTTTILVPSYQQGTALIDSKTYSYTGYQEAGEWIKNNVPEDSILFAGSWRSIGAFSAKEVILDSYQNSNYDPRSKIISLRSEEYKQNQSLFESDLNLISKEFPNSQIYLEIDIWEYTQASWYFPITMSSIEYFQSLGFEAVYVISRPYPSNQGLQDTSAIIIFKKTS